MRLALALVLLAGPAAAAGDKAAPKPPPFVDVYPFAAPIVRDGRLVNYVYVTLRLHGAQGGDVTALKRLEPQLRDAVVRAAHRRGFGDAADPTRVDSATVTAVALAEGRRLAGAATFVRAEVLKQTPQRTQGFKRSRTPAA
jgi:hypothetical protein